MTQPQPSFVIVCSGNGSNMKAILEASKEGLIPARPIAVISNSSKAGALSIAHEYGIETNVLNENSITERDQSFVSYIAKKKPDFIILAGYLKKIPDEIISLYPDRILNIHPSLLPEFGGKGMYGLHVHKAVIEAKKKTSGLTIHLVTKEYDKGRILKQVSTEVLSNETPESLSDRILKLEHATYPEVISEFIKNEF
jgi:phosphoribosylglycinamide formyltransferase 1